MRAYALGVHLAKTDREFTIKSYAKYTTVQDTTILQKAYDFYVGKIVEKAPYINMTGMQNALDEVAKTMQPNSEASARLHQSSHCGDW